MPAEPGAVNASDPAPLMEPADFARLVQSATDDQLLEGLIANGELILGEIFRQMEQHLRPDAPSDLEAVIEWRIADDRLPSEHRWQVVIADGACKAVPDGRHSARVTFTVGAVDFIRLVAGNVSGPKLFVFGRLTISGDLVLAARVPSLFTMPAP